MKKLSKTIIYLGLGLIFSSCGNDWLNLGPSTAEQSDKAIVDYKSASVALTGVYDGLQGSSSRTSYYAARMFYYGDVRGEDMQARTQGMRSSSCYEMRYIATDAPNMWSIPYNVIRRANNVIKALDDDKVLDATPDQLNNLRAEALVVRALVHFDLCRIYAKPYSMGDPKSNLGVPIVKVPLDMSAIPGRNTVEEVYKQVIDDLTEALSLKNGLKVEKNYGYVNVWFAKALLSRIYLYKEDNINALKYAEDVIANSPYKLFTNEGYVSGWTTTDKGREEMLFEIINASENDWSDREGVAYLANENGYADYIVTKSFLDMMNEDPNDVRNGILLEATDSTYIKTFGDNKIFMNKFPANPVTGEMRLNSLPILRLSEVYLNAAEAAAKLDNFETAAKYLNKIVLRANPAVTPLKTEEVTLKRILLERRKELIGEGHRFFDAMRNNETVTRYLNSDSKGFNYELSNESKSFDRTYFRTLLPIPLQEIQANPTLKGQQNPGY